MNYSDIKELDRALTIWGKKKMEVEETMKRMIDNGNLPLSYYNLLADKRNIDVKIKAIKEQQDRLRNPKAQEQGIASVKLPGGWPNNIQF